MTRKAVAATGLGLQALFAVAIAAMSASPSAAQLVIQGETIADARTFDAAKAEGRILVYSTYPAEMMNLILEGFAVDTGIKPELVRLPTPAMYQRITSEQSAGKLEADYIDLTDLPLVAQLVDRGILNVGRKVPSFEKIPTDIKDPTGRWYAVVRPISIISVNLSRVRENDIPKSWKDVLEPKWKGQLGVATIDSGGSAFTMYSFLRDKIDPEYWKKLAAQQPKLYPSVAPLAADIARGEIAVALGAISEQTIAQAKAGAPLRVIFPTEGISAFGANGGISSTAKNPNAAALLLDWLTSKRGGDIVAKVGAYPANPASDLPQSPGLAYPPTDRVWNLKADDWMSTRETWMQEWRGLFGTK
jgi:iron(III) transport system substrate-binding protein